MVNAKDGYQIETYITPASLDPGTWILSIEDLGVVKVHAILIDEVIVKVQTVTASDTCWLADLVVGVDVESIIWILWIAADLSKPAASIAGVRAVLPSYHSRVVTLEVRARPRDSTRGRLEDGTRYSCCVYIFM